MRSARYAADEHSAPEQSRQTLTTKPTMRAYCANYMTSRTNSAPAFRLRDRGRPQRTHPGDLSRQRPKAFSCAAPRGSSGFGYDPLFFFPQIDKTFAELTAEEKAKYSHRGAAFRAVSRMGGPYGTICILTRTVTAPVTIEVVIQVTNISPSYQAILNPAYQPGISLGRCKDFARIKRSPGFLTCAVCEIDNARFAFITPRIIRSRRRGFIRQSYQ